MIKEIQEWCIAFGVVALFVIGPEHWWALVVAWIAILIIGQQVSDRRESERYERARRYRHDQNL